MPANSREAVARLRDHGVVFRPSRPLLFLVGLLPLFLLPFIPAVFAPGARAEPPRTTDDADLRIGTYVVAKNGVVDGDTLRVEGRKRSLRLLSIDTEEMPRPGSMKPALRKLMRSDFAAYRARMEKGRPLPAKYPTPLGEAATAWARERLPPGTKVRLERDRPGQGADVYGRTLCHVWVLPDDGEPWLYNVEAVRAGLTPYTVKYGRSARFDAAFRTAQAEARAARRGIWDPERDHYPDYEERLAWWERRAKGLEALARLREKDPALVELGGRRAIRTLSDRVGKSVRAAGLVSEHDDRAVRLHDGGATVKAGGRYAIDVEIVGADLARRLRLRERMLGHHVLVEGPLDRRGSPIRLRNGREIRSLRIVVTRPGQVRLLHEMQATGE